MTDYGTPNAPDPADPNRWLVDSVRAVQLPGSALQWFGAASTFVAVLWLIVYLVSPDTFFRPVYDAVARQQEKRPAEDRVAVPPYKKWVQAWQTISVVSVVVAMAAGVVITIAGLKMKQLSGYGLAVTGAVLAILPLNSCCCAGLPVGLWAMVALFNSDVRLAFTRVGAAGGLDALTASLNADNPP
jgi:hypothetical protein